jgi:hypothetical protein
MAYLCAGLLLLACRCAQCCCELPRGSAGVCAPPPADTQHQPRNRPRPQPSAAGSSRRSSGVCVCARVRWSRAAAARGLAGAVCVPEVLAAAGLVAGPCGGTPGGIPARQRSSRRVCKGGCSSAQSSKFCLPSCRACTFGCATCTRQTNPPCHLLLLTLLTGQRLPVWCMCLALSGRPCSASCPCSSPGSPSAAVVPAGPG